MENWDEVWRRNQFLCANIARRFPDTKILFVGLQRNVARCLRGGKFDELLRNVTWTVPEYPNITVTRPLRFAPDTYAWGRACNQLTLRRHVRKAARQAAIRTPLLWLNPHYAVHMAGKMGEAGVVYDITDDWTLFPQPEALKRRVEAEDRELCRKADLVVVCSEALRQSRSACARRLLLLPNGVDPDHYRHIADGLLSRSGKWPAPVLGYTGTVHPSRVDTDLIVATARAFSHGSVVLVGPDARTPEMRARLEAEPNIHVPGPVPYAQVPQAMAEFDVCIVPHLETTFTESLNPLKLWEYLACGKPVVSTNVAGFRDYPHLCHVATGTTAFIEACRRALTEGGNLASERMEEASRHSWNARVGCLLNTLSSYGLA
jgi:glycosyltransferase involved in cell wall biosynthesis